MNYAIPWTGGNPKLGGCALVAACKFTIPWTGGNPKRTSRDPIDC